MDTRVKLELQHIQFEVENLIAHIPTGQLRNAICDVNILLMAAVGGEPLCISDFIEGSKTPTRKGTTLQPVA